jgi:ABC-type transporter Mla subunit MlaD
MYKWIIGRIARSSQRTLAAFYRVSNELDAHNTKLSATIAAINDSMIELNQHRLAAESIRAQNAGIISRIEALVNGPQ